MARFYVTTPIYYVNDVPHIGHAYTTVAGDVLTRWRRLLRRRGLLPDRHRRARPEGAARGRGEGRRRPRSSSTRPPAHFRDDVGRARHRLRRLHPHDRAASLRGGAAVPAEDLRRGRHRARHVRGPLLRLVRGVLLRGRARRRGNCPIHLRPVEHVVEENYFFKLSRFTDRLLAHYAAHPDAVQPESRMNEVLGFIRGGLQDFSMSRTSINWGVPLPVGPEARRVRVGRRVVQLLHRGRVRRPTKRASRSGGRSTTTSSARTSCASTRCTGPRC